MTTKELEFIQPLGLGREEYSKAQPQLRWMDSVWKPELPPEIPHGTPVGLDFEYIPDDRSPTLDRPISYSVYSPALHRAWYLPWGHLGGGNLPEEDCKRWFREQLRDRDVYGLNTKAEIHSASNWGLDPERLGIRPHDVAFSAALLNEERFKGFSLEALAEEYLPEGERKVRPATVPPQYFAQAHSGYVEERGRSDAYLAYRIHEETRAAILEEELDKVNDLEDRGIYSIVEMERNGAIIDRPKLERWIQVLENRVEERGKWLGAKVNLRLFNPDKDDHLSQLMASKGMVRRPSMFDEKEKRTRASWGAEALCPLAYNKGQFLEGIADPDWAAVLEVRAYKSILSKYLYKYLEAMDSNNVIRYGLHQMRSTKEPGGDDKGYGTVTGRFSCGGGKYNINIQQVMKAADQLEWEVYEFIIRELFIPAKGKVMGASDASQIEFRLFSHAAALFGYLSTSQAYARDPMIDFHLMVTKLMKPDLTDPRELKRWRKIIKHDNFGCLYGMGREKLARRLGYPCTCEGVDWNEQNKKGRRVRWFADDRAHASGCQAPVANTIMNEYEKKFPEAKFLLKRAAKAAEDKGFVATILGRRRRFHDGQKSHKAFNAWDQGSAADYFKTQMIYFHESKLVDLRMPVHDEFVYDVEPDPMVHKQVEELLNTQSWNLKVPLLFETGYGPNWRAANGA